MADPTTLDLAAIQQRVRQALTSYTADRVKVTDNRVVRDKSEGFVEAALVAILHLTDTRSPKARERWMTQAAYVFDLYHGRAVPKPKEGA